MDKSVDKVSFLKRQKPACTIFPFYDKLGKKPTLLNKLIERSFSDFGYNVFQPHCSKRELCVTGPCIGRPIPKYPELEKLHPEITKLETATHRGHEVYLYRATLCVNCPIKDSCGKPCSTMISYLDKDLDVEDAMAVDGEFNVNGQYRNSFNEEEMEDDILSRRLTSEDFVKRVPFTREDIPWGALTENEEFIVKSRVFNSLTFKEIAESLPHSGLLKTATRNIKRDFSRAIDKLRKAGLEIRKDLLDKN
jgi:hypothetical protein